MREGGPWSSDTHTLQTPGSGAPWQACRSAALPGRYNRPQMSTPGRAVNRSPTMALLVGLVLTLAVVVAYSWYITGQISGLRRLQTELTDRNRRESLQLLRIQNDLNQLALAMRDMLDGDEPYPAVRLVGAVRAHPHGSRRCAAQQEAVAVARRTPEQAQYLAQSVAQFWDAADRIFALARAGARTRRARRSACRCRRGRRRSAPPWRGLLVQNNESEGETARRCRRSTTASSGRSTGSWPPRWWRSRPPASI